MNDRIISLRRVTLTDDGTRGDIAVGSHPQFLHGVRRGGHLFPLLVSETQAFYLIGKAVGRQDVERVADEEFITLGDDANIILITAFFAHRYCVIAADLAAVDRFLTRLAEEEAGGIGAVADLLQLLDDPRTDMIIRIVTMIPILVDSVAVGVGRHAGIIVGFCPALDLEAVDARLNQFGDMLDHAQIARIIQICALVILFYREELSLAVFFIQMILPSAGLCAVTAVRVTTGHKG